MGNTGECAQAQVQLLTIGILNIVTDFMLLVLPIPVVWSLKATWQRKVQLLCLFTLGIFIIAITLVRLPINAINIDSQLNRTTWVSIELLTAAVVVNAPSIYGLWNKRRRDKLDTVQRREQMARARGGQGHISTIGSTESYLMQTRKKTTAGGGVMVTKDLTVTTTYAFDRHCTEPSMPEATHAETPSRGSSQRGILHHQRTFYRE